MAVAILAIDRSASIAVLTRTSKMFALIVSDRHSFKNPARNF
jgi:hypothetical protein